MDFSSLTEITLIIKSLLDLIRLIRYNFILIQGNEKLHHLLSQGSFELRMDMSDFTDQTRYVKYTHVDVMDESSKYTISISGYSGNVGNMLNITSSKSAIGISRYSRNVGNIINNTSLTDYTFFAQINAKI